MRILLDPGHGGRDSGAVIGNIKEADLNWAICEHILGAAPYTEQVIFTRSFATPGKVTLKDRISTIKLVNPDCFISIHCNSAPSPQAKGYEIWAYKLPNLLASKIFTSLKNQSYLPPREIKQGNFYVLKCSKVPACLIEVGFMSNQYDLSYLRNSTVQTRIGSLIWEGIKEWWESGQDSYYFRSPCINSLIL